MRKLSTSFTTPYFSLTASMPTTRDGIRVTRIAAKDRFSRRRYVLERKLFGLFASYVQRYLERRPQLGFDDPKNLMRKVVFLPPSMRTWAGYMPGAFATHPVHNPDAQRLKDGQKIDYLTRNLFRHSIDGVGLRSRAYTMAWFIYKKFADRQDAIRWLSLATGTAQPTYDAATLFDPLPKLFLTDTDRDALAFARNLRSEYGMPKANVHTDILDVKNSPAVRSKIASVDPHVVDMMGIVEYLSDEEACELFKVTYQAIGPGGVIVFNNMQSSRPGLDAHERGIGWPGVTPRRVSDVVALLEKAKIEKSKVDVLLPDDGVYAVYCVQK